MVAARLLRSWIALVIGVGCGVVLHSRVPPQVLAVRLENGMFMGLTIQLSPPVEAWDLAGQGEYLGGGYRLTIEEQTATSGSLAKVSLVREGQQRFTVERFRAEWEIADPELYAIWTYNHVPNRLRNYRALATESFADLTAPNSGIPFATAVDRGGINRLAVGLKNQHRVVNLRGEPLESGGYRLSLETRLPVDSNKFEEILYADTAPQDWFSVTRRYADWVDEELTYEPFPVAPGCYSPMYDVWYWAFDDTSPELYWTTLARASQIGFKAYLFDAGWESETGELSKWLEGSIGDYAHPEHKLPGFPELLQFAKNNLRMNTVLWMSPYAVGRESTSYPRTRRSHVLFDRRNPEFNGGLEMAPMTLQLGRRYDENVNLCPRHSGTREHLKSLFERVSNDYRPSGYWLDFQETVPFLCESFHEHQHDFSDGFNLSQKQIKQAVISTIEYPTVELRFPVANLNNKPYGNIWQSIDSPGDFDTMRLCSMMMRPFSRGVVMGTDEMYWPPGANAATVSKFAATTVLSGVPAIGANFGAAPKFHSRIVRAWLQFYQANRGALTDGEFLPFGDFELPNHRIESPDAAFVYLRKVKAPGEVPLDGHPSVIYLVNCTDSDEILALFPKLEPGAYDIVVLNEFLQLRSRRIVHLDAQTPLHENVARGNTLRVTPLLAPDKS
ncbi:MAG: hypothetical protein FJW26_19055 [Acidimicrobiia bacterium]|nr:hypothetical protein [Acidimicrobiia bacterium]